MMCTGTTSEQRRVSRTPEAMTVMLLIPSVEGTPFDYSRPRDGFIECRASILAAARDATLCTAAGGRRLTRRIEGLGAKLVDEGSPKFYVARDAGVTRRTLDKWLDSRPDS